MKTFVFFLFLTKYCSGFFPALFQLEKAIKCMAKKPRSGDHLLKINQLCGELDIYYELGIVKSHATDLSGNWRLISSTGLRHSFSYQLFDLNNKRVSNIFKCFNGTVIEHEYKIEMPSDKFVIYTDYLEKIKFQNGTTKLQNDVNKSFECEIVYLSPSIRIDRKTNGELMVYEPTPVYESEWEEWNDGSEPF